MTGHKESLLSSLTLLFRLLTPLKIGRVFGIDIKVHPLFIVLIVLISLSYMVKSGSLILGMWVLYFILLVILFVLLHEMGHALMAQKLGLGVADITLWPLGGMARLVQNPDDPAVELRIALAGPAVNFAIILVALGAALILQGWESINGIELGVLPYGRFGLETFIYHVITLNAVLGIFNLAPAFPMDGGRVLRALAAMKLSYLKATTLAVRISKIMAVVFLVFLFVTGSLFSMVTLIPIFVYWAASQELIAVRTRAFAEDVRNRFPFGGWDPRPRRDDRHREEEIIEADVVLKNQNEGSRRQRSNPAASTPSRSPGSGEGEGESESEGQERRDLRSFEREFLRIVERYRKGKGS